MSADRYGVAVVVAVGDPAANRVVYGTVIALIVIGVVLVGVAIWMIRQTRVDPELLAPLERMSERSWQKKDPATQRRMLDEVRPDGASPLHREPGAPELVEEFDKPAPVVATFDDLKEPDAGSVEPGAESGAGLPDPRPDGVGSADEGTADAASAGEASAEAGSADEGGSDDDAGAADVHTSAGGDASDAGDEIDGTGSDDDEVAVAGSVDGAEGADGSGDDGGSTEPTGVSFDPPSPASAANGAVDPSLAPSDDDASPSSSPGPPVEADAAGDGSDEGRSVEREHVEVASTVDDASSSGESDDDEH